MSFLDIIVTNMFEVNLDSLFIPKQFDIKTLQNKIYDSIDKTNLVFMYDNVEVKVRFKYINNTYYDKDKTIQLLFEYEFSVGTFKSIESTTISIYDNLIQQTVLKEHIVPIVASIYNINTAELYKHTTLRRLGYSTRTCNKQ